MLRKAWLGASYCDFSITVLHLYAPKKHDSFCRNRFPTLLRLPLYGRQARACSKEFIPKQVLQHIGEGVLEQVVRARDSPPRARM
jgi:hypothetical protein